MKQYFYFLFFLGALLKAQYPNDCTEYIQACGNKSISLDVRGAGQKEETRGKGCNSHEHNSLWIRISIQKEGTLGFILRPESNDIEEDYDFWIFGPNKSCDNLNNSIRCSTTNPTAIRQLNNFTGLKDSESDLQEGPGSLGNSFVKSLNVNAGESYFLVIDRPIGQSRFTLEWTGTAKLVNPLEDKTITENLQDISICDSDFNGHESFNLRSLDDKILTDRTGISIKYYKSESDANIDANPLPDIAEVRQQYYYARVENIATRCYTISKFKINLSHFEFSLDDINLCPDAQGNYHYTPKDITIPEKDNYVSYAFYSNQNDAKLGNNNTLDENKTYTISHNTKIFIRVQTATCFGIGQVNLVTKSAPILNLFSQKLCLDKNNLSIDLNNYKNNISSENINFYLSEEDFRNNKPIQNISEFQVNQGNTQIYAGAKNDFCPSIAPVVFNIFQNPEINIPSSIQFCKENLPAVLKLPEIDNTLTYVWNFDNENEHYPVIKEFGKYQLKIIDQNQCHKTYDFEILENTSSQIKTVVSQTNKIEIIPLEKGDFLYSIDKVNWQESPIFKDLQNGNYKAYIKKKNGCISEAFNVLILGIYNFITPNGDGLNDFIHFPAIEGNGSLEIFDRNGHTIFKNDLKSDVNWNGKLQGKPLPQGDYWYIINTEKQLYKGHITIKNH